jgi:hypothetical protein
VPSERCSVEEQLVEYFGLAGCVWRRGTWRSQTAPQLIISYNTLGTLPEDGNVMPKHVVSVHN